MASADFELSISIDCENEEIIEMLKAFREYTTGNREAYFTFVEVNRGEDELDIENASDEEIENFICENDGEVSISAIGPFGHYGLLNDVDVFREMSEAAPNGWFEADINGTTTYTMQNLHCELIEGKLNITTYYEANETRGDAYAAYVEEKLPHLVFTRLFRISAEEFDEYEYTDFLSCTLIDEDEGFASLEYEDFIDEFDGLTDITSDEFRATVAVISSLGIQSYQDYVFDHEDEFGDEEEFVYDPVSKSYIGNDNPFPKSNTAYNVNEYMREQLKNLGRPHSDEDLAALSIEDAYALITGTYALDHADEIGDSLFGGDDNWE